MAFLFLSMLTDKLIKAIIFPLHCTMNDVSQDGCSSSESFLMLVVGDVTLEILWRNEGPKHTLHISHVHERHQVF